MSFVIIPGELLRRKSEGLAALREAYKSHAMGEIPWERLLLELEHEMPGDAFELMCDFARRALDDGLNPIPFRVAATMIACGRAF